MAIPRSQIVRGSEAFEFDTQGHLAILDEVRNAAEMVAAGGSAASRQRHVARGKLLPRRRVSRLLDPGSPFLEIGAFAAHGLHDGASRGAGSIAGISRVEGVEAMVFCDDPTLRGGACCPLTVKKHPRAREIAAENNPRCIHVVGYGRAVAGLRRSRQARRLLADVGSPLCDPDEMPGPVPPDPRTPHDIREVNRADAVGGFDDAGDLSSIMPGLVTVIRARRGDAVEKGTPLLTIEAMKMERTFAAPHHRCRYPGRRGPAGFGRHPSANFQAGE